MTIAAPQSTKDATRLLQRFARAEQALATMEATRRGLVAKINAATDKKTIPLVKLLGEISEALQPWWRENAAELTKGERKSVELGGCVIGTSLLSPSLAYAQKDADFGLAKLQAAKWAKPYVRVTYAVDKAKVRTGLKGKHGEALKSLGYSEVQPETFFIRALDIPSVKA